jgi:hypothetical protein
MKNHQFQKRHKRNFWPYIEEEFSINTLGSTLWLENPVLQKVNREKANKRDKNKIKHCQLSKLSNHDDAV